jgi:hypothetical protein
MGVSICQRLLCPKEHDQLYFENQVAKALYCPLSRLPLGAKPTPPVEEVGSNRLSEKDKGTEHVLF